MVVVCSVPLLGEAVRAALEFADVHTFDARANDLDGLVRSLRPDALIVDSQAGAEQAAAFAHEHNVPVLYVSVRDRQFGVYRSGTWEYFNNVEGPTPEAIRNVVAGALFARTETGT